MTPKAAAMRQMIELTYFPFFIFLSILYFSHIPMYRTINIHQFLKVK